MRRKSGISILLLIAGCFFVVAGCAAKPQRPPTGLVERVAQIKVYGIVPPDITIFVIGVDGVAMPRGELAEKAKETVVKEVIKTFREKGIEVRSLPGGENQGGEQPFPVGVDALINIKGYDYIVTTGRKVLKTTLQVMGFNPGGEEKTYLQVYIVDAAGISLWHGEKQYPKIGYDLSRGKDWLKVVGDSFMSTSLWNVYGDCAYDLSEPEKCASFVRDLLADYLRYIR